MGEPLALLQRLFLALLAFLSLKVTGHGLLALTSVPQVALIHSGASKIKGGEPSSSCQT